MKKIASVLSIITALLLPALAFAIAPDTHTVHPGGFPTPASNIAAEVTQTYNIIFWIIAVIAALVYGVMLYAIWRFRRSKNPVPAKFSHGTVIEVVWTVIPALICVYIGWESYRILHLMHNTPKDGITVEVVAYQFGWDFHYPDLGISAPEATAPHPTLSIPGKDRLVKEFVVPVDTNVRLQVTAMDVIHSYFVPAMGTKMDAIPGRVNYKWFRPNQVGSFIGQCAELCGAAHGEMFFSVKVVPQDEWQVWVNEQRKAKGLEPLKIASATDAQAQ
jgi:cytochrome c oxidase subunit 2